MRVFVWSLASFFCFASQVESSQVVVVVVINFTTAAVHAINYCVAWAAWVWAIPSLQVRVHVRQQTSQGLRTETTLMTTRTDINQLYYSEQAQQNSNSNGLPSSYNYYHCHYCPVLSCLFYYHSIVVGRNSCRCAATEPCCCKLCVECCCCCRLS